jgi:hypothetical protein
MCFSGITFTTLFRDENGFAEAGHIWNNVLGALTIRDRT